MLVLDDFVPCASWPPAARRPGRRPARRVALRRALHQRRRHGRRGHLGPDRRQARCLTAFAPIGHGGAGRPFAAVGPRARRQASWGACQRCHPSCARRAKARKALNIAIFCVALVLAVLVALLILARFAGGWGVPYFSTTTDRGSHCVNTFTGFECDSLTLADVGYFGDVELPPDTRVVSAHYKSDARLPARRGARGPSGRRRGRPGEPAGHVRPLREGPPLPALRARPHVALHHGERPGHHRDRHPRQPPVRRRHRATAPTRPAWSTSPSVPADSRGDLAPADARGVPSPSTRTLQGAPRARKVRAVTGEPVERRGAGARR